MRRTTLLLLAPVLLAPLCGKDDATDSNTLPDGGTTATGLLTTGLPGTGGTTDVTTTENLDCVIAWAQTGGDGAVVIASADGNELSRVDFGTTGAQPGSRVVFSPDGTRLAMVADNLDDGSGGTNRDAMFTMTLEGNEQREASGSAHFFSSIEGFSWSADGAMVAFWGVDWGEPRSQSGTGPADYIYWLAGSDEVFTARIDGTSVLKRSEDTPPYDYDAVEPVFSPVGSLLAWVQYSIDYDDLVVLDTAGSAPPTVFDEPHHFRSPAWSPDGSKIYFGSDEGGTWNIWSMAPDGSNRAQLTEGMRVLPSPDGNHLLVQVPAADVARVTDADGSNPIDLPAEARFGWSSWGPNGTLYHLGGSIGQDLYVYDVATGTDTKLVDQADDPDVPGVSPLCF